MADPAGSAIPEAKVTIENQSTGVKQALVTNSDGRFVQPYLASGDYRLTVEKVGFSRNVTNDIKVDVQQTVGLDIALKVGEITTTVEVKAEVAQLKTETSSASTTITSKQIHDLPTGRNPFALATLTPGVIPAGGGSTPWISGGRNASSEILIDGNTAIVPENNVSINDGGYTPVIDSVEELTVIKNSMAAEYGRSGGGVITVATRSGTNELHFGLFEYFRNPALNANTLGQQPERRQASQLLLHQSVRFQCGRAGDYSPPVQRTQQDFHFLEPSVLQKSRLHVCYRYGADPSMEGRRFFAAQERRRRADYDLRPATGGRERRTVALPGQRHSQGADGSGCAQPDEILAQPQQCSDQRLHQRQ